MLGYLYLHISNLCHIKFTNNANYSNICSEYMTRKT